MDVYDPQNIEQKWQKYWQENNTFKAKGKCKKPKFYILDMFPYPSGAGLHVGHPRGYIGSDIIARYMKMKGYNVLHPMGWDAFGLPAENYAIKTGIHPEISTKENIARFKKQMEAIGLSYNWSREINTSDPDYYKWTQWIFLKLFEKGLAYQATLPINWCPSCKTGLANEEVVNGKCERCGVEVTKKDLKQWVLKITDYSQKLLDGLEGLDWPEKIKEMQKNWIGRSEGADIIFKVKGSEEKIKVFTTRPDTIFGATFLVLAPEHSLVEKICSKEKLAEVKQYQEQAKKKLDIERQLEDKEKTGVFIGAYAVNPANNKEIPIYIADYVLPYYGYGAIMAVPAHDERDKKFAEKYHLEIAECEIGEKILQWLKQNNIGTPAINYKLRDWVFSRQRYWGEPIPLVFCERCKTKITINNYKEGDFSKGELLNPGWVALKERQLPLVLPKIEKFQPTGTGESPLATLTDWVKTKCPKCGGKAIRETNTMPQWAGSCWYFIRYADSKNKKTLIKPELAKQWLPVDFYIGGAEHAVLHLLYSRFWIRVLQEENVIEFSEPFLKLRTIGLILAPDGQKMSKSRGNVINPDDLINQYGADAFRVYEMFMGPFDQPISWDTNGILGAKRFLDKISQIKTAKKTDAIVKKELNKTIKKVTEDIQEQKFNTAISCMMEFVNLLQGKSIGKKDFNNLLKILSPFAPHLAEEVWGKKSIFEGKWPSFELIAEETIPIIIQVNGKVRDTIEVKPGIDELKMKEVALKSEKIKKWLAGKEIRKVIFVKDKLINLVI